MNSGKKSYQELLEREISLLNALSDSLIAAKDAIVSFKVQDLEETIGAQKLLSGQIAANNAEMRRTYPLAAMQDREQISIRALQARWQESRSRLQKLNFEHQVLLLRTRRTISAILNGFRSFEGNYAAEALRQQAAGNSLRERA